MNEEEIDRITFRMPNPRYIIAKYERSKPISLNTHCTRYTSAVAYVLMHIVQTRANCIGCNETAGEPNVPANAGARSAPG